MIARPQLLELGLSARAIDEHVATGRLHVIHRGVYAVGHRSLTPYGRWMAAVLACGPGAVLSHQSAAALWGLRRTARRLIDVTVPGRTRRTKSGIAVHRAGARHPEDRADVEGIPVTSVALTLLDLAEVLRPRELRRAFEEAERLRLLDLDAVERLMRRSHGRRGLRALAKLVREARPVEPTRSELEALFLDLCREHGLPRPTANAVVEGFEVDMLWRRERLVVELDGYAFHRTRAAFENDRIRDETLELADYRVVRVTHRRLHDEPSAVAASVRRLLAAQRRR